MTTNNLQNDMEEIKLMGQKSQQFCSCHNEFIRKTKLYASQLKNLVDEDSINKLDNDTKLTYDEKMKFVYPKLQSNYYFKVINNTDHEKIETMDENDSNNKPQDKDKKDESETDTENEKNSPWCNWSNWDDWLKSSWSWCDPKSVDSKSVKQCKEELDKAKETIKKLEGVKKDMTKKVNELEAQIQKLLINIKSKNLTNEKGHNKKGKTNTTSSTSGGVESSSCDEALVIYKPKHGSKETIEKYKIIVKKNKNEHKMKPTKYNIYKIKNDSTDDTDLIDDD